MSRGLGRTQQRILIELRRGGRVGVIELAECLGIDPRQARRAVQSLAQRDLVRLSTESTRLRDGRHAPAKLFVWIPFDPEKFRTTTRSVRDFAMSPPLGLVATAKANTRDLVAANREELRRKLERPKPSGDVIDLDERRK